MSKNPWGHSEFMVTAAFRYCLGRRSAFVSDCVAWLVENWDEFSEQTRTRIQKELEEAFAQDDEDRCSKGIDVNVLFNIPFPLGDNCDRAEWEKVRSLYKLSSPA